MVEISEKYKRLIKWRNNYAKMEHEYGAELFHNWADYWFDDPHWFCENGHVSGIFLKCEEDGDLCLECRCPVILGPPVGESEFAMKYKRYIDVPSS